MNRMRALFQQVAGYAAASLLALAADMSVLWILVRYFHWAYLAAATVSFLTGASVAYYFSSRLVFKEHRMNSRAAEFASFVAIGTLGLAVNALVIEIAVERLGLHIMIAKCVAAGCTFVCNFVARRQLLFVRPREIRVRDLSHE
jgi:putative flippase GtrA